MFSAVALIAEMKRAGVKPAGQGSGWNWRSLDGRWYWVTTL